MNELALVTEGTGLKTLDDKALARIEAGMCEQRRISAIFGRSNSQTTTKLMSLTMLTAGPYRQLRQCAAEIEKRKAALTEAAIRLKRTKLEADKARQDAETLTGLDRELRQLDVAEKEAAIDSSRIYVEGALKDIAALQDAYEQIRKSHDIRESWDEADFEVGEIEHHLRSLFRIAYRDVVQTGRVSIAACEYAEQFGVHPQVLAMRVTDYVQGCNQMLNSGQAPNISHFHQWLDACYEAHKNDVHAAVTHLGLTDLITKWSLYVEPE